MSPSDCPEKQTVRLRESGVIPTCRRRIADQRFALSLRIRGGSFGWDAVGSPSTRRKCFTTLGNHLFALRETPFRKLTNTHGGMHSWLAPVSWWSRVALAHRLCRTSSSVLLRSVGGSNAVRRFPVDQNGNVHLSLGCRCWPAHKQRTLLHMEDVAKTCEASTQPPQ